jgi:photosystem II stability/assembly factor-like uncharacterized protein
MPPTARPDHRQLGKRRHHAGGGLTAGAPGPRDCSAERAGVASTAMFRTGLVVVVVAAAAAIVGCGEPDASPTAEAQADPGLVHIHGLGVNPADDALFVATHTGLFRVADGEQTPQRVGREQQDTMGFSVVGPDRFLGSGHPDLRTDQPPFLGLIESADAGASWEPVSLLGEVDFHVLESAGERVYGFGSNFRTREATFLASSDAGESWEERAVPELLVSLAIDPRDSRHLVAAGEQQTFASGDEGRTWRPLSDVAGLLTWAAPEALHVVASDGSTALSADGGRSWKETGSVGGAPAAFEAAAGTLYVALHDGTVKQSFDGGKTWTVRATAG